MEAVEPYLGLKPILKHYYLVQVYLMRGCISVIRGNKINDL